MIILLVAAAALPLQPSVTPELERKGHMAYALGACAGNIDPPVELLEASGFEKDYLSHMWQVGRNDTKQAWAKGDYNNIPTKADCKFIFERFNNAKAFPKR